MREKLIELIQAAKSKKLYDFLFGNIDDAIDIKSEEEYIADHLIANGVTIQRWIPVTERLPKPEENPVLAVHCGIVNPAWYHRGEWEFPSLFTTKHVTHWMPLPDPPKGE